MQIETWSPDEGKGIDDVLKNGGTPRVTDVKAPPKAKRRRRASADAVSRRIDNLAVVEIETAEELLDRLSKEKIIEDIAGLSSDDNDAAEAAIERIRARFGLTEDAVESLRRRIEAVECDDDPEEGTPSEKRKAAELLVEIGLQAKLFHTGEKVAFAVVDFQDHARVMPVRGGDFRDWLVGRYWAAYKLAAPDAAIASALGVLQANAKFDGPTLAVHLRAFRESPSCCWYDLADEKWRAVKITRRGWSIVQRPPVLFQRFKKTAPQVEPVRGGNLDELWRFLRVKSANDKVLILSWLIAALIEGSPRPIIVITGEHGTAKSTTCRILRRLIDPAFSELVTPPDSPREYAQSATHGYVLAFDNVSDIPPWLSDSMCRTTTGDAFEKRALYSDEDDVIWRFRRPIIINGIGSIVTRADLLDRSILITLDAFEESERKGEDEVWAEFEEARPRILGALLDTVAKLLRVLPGIATPSAYRMADFARIGVGLEVVIGWRRGSFRDAMEQNAELQVEESIEASSVAQAAVRYMQSHDCFEGSATELMKEFVNGWDKDSMGPAPKSAARLVKELKRAAPSLRRVGVDFRTGRRTDHNRSRFVMLSRLAVPSAPSVPSAGEHTSAAASPNAPSQTTAQHHLATPPEDATEARTVRTDADSTSAEPSANRPHVSDHGDIVEGDA